MSYGKLCRSKKFNCMARIAGRFVVETKVSKAERPSHDPPANAALASVPRQAVRPPEVRQWLALARR